MTNVIATLRDRKIFFVGVNTGYITNGLPDDRYINFYQHRASPQLHCIILGNVVVPGGHRSNGSTPALTTDEVWGRIAKAIDEAGSLPGIQLATVWEGYVGIRKFVGTAPARVIAAARQLVDQLGSARIAAILKAFELAATMATDHGFRHIQVHGAHGYLLNLLLDSRINPRSNEVLEQLSGLASRLKSAGVETSIRISLRTGDAKFDSAGTTAFHDRIAALTFDYVDLSSGFYNIDKRLIYPGRPEFFAARLAESRAVAERHPTRAFIFSGRAMQNGWDRLPTNLHIGLCRDLIANPKFLSNLTQGCRNRGKCHYFSRGEGFLTCALWRTRNISQ